MISTFYVAFDDERDDVTPVIVRAMALLYENGRTVPTAGDGDPDASDGAPPDVLADLRAVLGDDVRVRTQVVLQRLAERDHGVYGGWSFQQLADALAEHGLTARKYNGVMVVRTADVARVLAERDDADGDDDV